MACPDRGRPNRKLTPGPDHHSQALQPNRKLTPGPDHHSQALHGVNALTIRSDHSEGGRSIFYFAGELGAKETYVLTVKGPASITLFLRQGTEILSAEGSGTVKLEAVLPATDVYTVAIARKLLGQSYTLSRRATTPTLAEALMAQGIGYLRQMKDGSGDIDNCWVIPGVKAKRIYPALVEEQTLAADRNTVSFVSRKASGTSTGQLTFAIVGANYERVVVSDDGRTGRGLFLFDPIPDLDDAQRRGNYFCKP